MPNLNLFGFEFNAICLKLVNLVYGVVWTRIPSAMYYLGTSMDASGWETKVDMYNHLY